MLSTTFLTRRSVLAGCGAMLAAPLAAMPLPLIPYDETQDGIIITTKDLSPRFLDFYQAAANADPDARFALWKDRYDFAAVPPTPEGDAMARKLLDAAWPKYAAALPLIRKGAAGMRPRPINVARQVADLLAAPRPLHVGITAYVGGFETNAFTAGTDNGPVIALPIEMDEATRALLLRHEMTHAVHMIVAGLSPGYERTLGRLIFEEGLAMHAVKRLLPGRADHVYVGEKTWFERAAANRQPIFAALEPVLAATDGATLFKFTMGEGATGIEREAYLAGWCVVGRLLAEGKSLADLARIPEADMPSLVQRVLRKFIAAGKDRPHAQPE